MIQLYHNFGLFQGILVRNDFSRACELSQQHFIRHIKSPHDCHPLYSLWTNSTLYLERP
jgi:hypothetical protein